MKTINLISLVNARKDLQSNVFENYLSMFGIKDIRCSELDDLECLIKNLDDNTDESKVFNNYYFSFTINQINKEFDLLRFGDSYIINIELKRESTRDLIREQLIKNKYYLSFLNKKIYSFTYVANENTLYQLDEDNKLIDIDFKSLISLIEGQEIDNIINIQSLFNPSNYLISPFNSTEEFIKDKYFLTNHQMDIKKSIEKCNSLSEGCFIAIEGGAGTGKTLLAYDIAKKHINDSKSVLIIHCGMLNDGHKRLISKYGWTIISAKEFGSLEDLSEYDFILVDEVQRMYKHQLTNLIDMVKRANNICIFSYDKLQCLASFEIERDNPKYIEENTNLKKFKLTEKIRTNKEIAAFIKHLFNIRKGSPKMEYSNIDIQYFSTNGEAVEYMKGLENEGYKVINYTPSQYTHVPLNRLFIWGEENAHEVIGQEFDNVVAVVDKYFYYKDSGELSTKGYISRPYYHPTKMLFQILTRTRNKLTIVIVNNKDLLAHCMKILEQNKH